MADEETTNAVLKEMVIGLTKLTDERFSGIKESLGRIENITQNFATKKELEEVKNDFTKVIQGIAKQFEEHNKDDKDNFRTLGDGQQETRDTIKIWIGGLTIIAILLPIVVPIIFHVWFHF